MDTTVLNKQKGDILTSSVTGWDVCIFLASDHVMEQCQDADVRVLREREIMPPCLSFIYLWWPGKTHLVLDTVELF